MIVPESSCDAVTDLDILDEMVANDALGLIDDMTETDA